MERNQIIGILLMLAMLVAYQFLAPKPAPEKEPAKTTATKPSSNTALTAKANPAAPQTLDSVAARAQFGDFAKAAQGQSRDIVLENAEVKITFSTQGGRVKEVLLKKYKTFDRTKNVVLVDAKTNTTALELPTNRGKVDLHRLFYTTDAQSGTVSGKPQTITFRAEIAPGQSVEQTYTVPAEGYTIDYNLKMNGLQNMVGKDNLRFIWENRMPQFENDMTENRKSATINYFTNDQSFSNIGEGTGGHTGAPDKPVQWFAIKHKYFLAGLIAQNSPMPKTSFATVVDEVDSSTVKTATADVQLSMADITAGKGQYKFFYGPNDYQLLGSVAPGFNRNVYLGYALLKPVNEFFFVPVFNWFTKVFTNYGILIVMLVVFVKLLLTPLTYRAYISQAKMRVLAPEVAAIRERVGDDDAAKLQSEQMKLYNEVGVSPLSGCIPVLATLPVLMSLFFLFPNLIELRQQSFLWSNDLSTYDTFFKFPFTVPFLGNHLSLFTVLMTASSIVYAWYNNQTTPQQPGPVDMKTLSYIFPLMFMFVLNSFPAGLTWYYFVSNVVTISQQQLIRRFVDEGAIKVKLEENRKKNATGEAKKPGGFQAMLQKQLAAAEEARKAADDSQKRLETRAGKKK
jgi:YidC/Oxa1 family membrane protein insertase